MEHARPPIMECEALALPGLLRLNYRTFRDERGAFVKTFHADLFARFGIRHQIAEEFYSASARGVIRGMHFQIPPHDHTKLVYCAHGRVLDVVLDLRRGSPTCGQWHAEVLDAEKPTALFIPRGMAHGFQSLEDGSLVFYSVSSVHHPASDCGIRWDSFGFSWPQAVTGISPRDQSHPALADWTSPFVFEG